MKNVDIPCKFFWAYSRL